MIKPKALVLGASGMLGSMVYDYLDRSGAVEVSGTVRTPELRTRDELLFDAHDFLHGRFRGRLEADYIINCIGVIKPYCTDNDPAGVRRAIEVNALFPHHLGSYGRENRVKVIQIATDCVYSGAAGNYDEAAAHDPLDVYGKTKSLGEVFDKSMLNIRCSIIGPEKKGKTSLLEWFLGQQDGAPLKGFAHHRWNGVTTLQFARLCEKIIVSGAYERLLEKSHVHHFVPNATVSKFELLGLMSSVFGRRHAIERVDNIGVPIDRTLSSRFDLLGDIYGENRDMKSALVELKAVMSESRALS